MKKLQKQLPVEVEMIRLAALFIMFIFVAECRAQFTAPKHFTGTWRSDRPQGYIIEHWAQVSDSALTGYSYRVIENDTLPLESISIKYLNDTLRYIPRVYDQNKGREIIYTLVSRRHNSDEFIFENPYHDFPQRIRYQFKSASMLNASIEGKLNGKEKKIEFKYIKIQD